MTELKVLRVKNSKLGIICFGDRELHVEDDKEALLKELSQHAAYLSTPVSCVLGGYTDRYTTTLFYWLMENNVDMSNIYVMDTYAHTFLMFGCIEHVSKPKIVEHSIVVELTDDQLEFAEMLRNILLSLYKLYYRKEMKKHLNVKLREDIQSKMQEFVANFNEIADTEVSSLYKLASRNNIRALGDFTTEQVSQLYKLGRSYSRLCNYLNYGPRSYINLRSNASLCYFNRVRTINTELNGANVFILDPCKYFTLDLYGLFVEGRYKTGMASNEYATKILGFTDAEYTKGLKHLREQGIATEDLLLNYRKQLRKPESVANVQEYNIALSKFMNTVTRTMAMGDQTAHITDIGQSVGFAFSNCVSVARVIQVLRDALRQHSEVAEVFDAVAVKVDGEKVYVPLQNLLSVEVLPAEYKSRNCLKDLLNYLQR